ncbi:rod-binding protein [Lachnospiraceae bacterium OttesenSCG-928-D06]|nr:rod-binding protein [Lachnospiraceae bacterium OttesenSCG-928-D06]
MEINNMGLTDYYADVYGTSSQSTSKLEGQLGSDYANATDEELMDVCKQFESYFLEQVYKQMWKTVPKSEESSGATSTLVDYFKDEFVQQMATDSIEQNTLGLAQTLYEQMKRNYSE